MNCLHVGTLVDENEMTSRARRPAPSSTHEEPPMRTMTLSRRIALFICSLGWHRRPFEQEPPRDNRGAEAHRFRSRAYCRRCGLVGRLDTHGNLDPDAPA
jgi:hypothetical protein